MPRNCMNDHTRTHIDLDVGYFRMADGRWLMAAVWLHGCVVLDAGYVLLVAS